LRAITETGLSRAAVHAKAISIVASAAVTFGVFLGGFVINEPAPYELYMVALMAVWALFGLRISRHASILLTLLILFNIGGLMSIGVMGELYSALYCGFAVSRSDLGLLRCHPRIGP
jgi:hypothetical protein